MPANVETMFSVREVPWHGLGTIVQEAPNSAEALRLAGLDWTVEKKNIQVCGGRRIEGNFANVRSSDGAVMGVVGNQYTIVQNADAFAFTDEIIGGDVRYETAGSLKGGRTVWMLARLPETKILGDVIEPYLCFTNSHDGTGAVRVCICPIRVVCSNTLNAALSTAKRKWSARHVGDMTGKLEDAQRTLELAGRYMERLDVTAERLANERMSDDEIRAVVEAAFPLEENDPSKRAVTNATLQRDAFYACYFAPDLVKFLGTKWGVMNAAADMAGHTAIRQTKNFEENRWGKIIDGHPTLDKFAELLSVAAISA